MNRAIVCVVVLSCALLCASAASACPQVAVASVQAFAVCPQVAVQSFAVQQQVVQAQAVAFAPVCVQAVQVAAVCPSGGCEKRQSILGRLGRGSRSRSVAKSVSVVR